MAVPKIDEEAKMAARFGTDIDKYRPFYMLRNIDEDTGDVVYVNFVSPSISVYEKYRYVLLKDSTRKDLEPKYYYRPDYVSYNEYGTVTLWTMLLYINNIPTIEEFNVANILIPSRTSINRLIRESIPPKVPIDVASLMVAPVNIETAKLYSKYETLALNSDIEVPVAPVFNPTIHFFRQIFDVNNVIAAGQYIELGYEPIQESIDFKIKGQTSFIYDTHYSLVKGSNGDKNRISWHDADNRNGDGLADVIIEGMVLEVQYARKA